VFCGHEVASGVKSVSAVLLHYALYECDCTVKESLVKSGGTVQAVRIVPDTTPIFKVRCKDPNYRSGRAGQKLYSCLCTVS
jgi:hypothetical protein